MFQKRTRQAAVLTLSLITLCAVSACSTNPYSAQSSAHAKRPAGPLRLPADADLSEMDRQFELAGRGLYLLPDGSVKPLPPEPAQPAPQPVADISREVNTPKASPRRTVRRAQVQRVKSTSEAMVFDALPAAVDITKGAGQ